MKKKGVLLTLGLTMLALIVLALAVLMFRHTQKSEETVATLMVLERLYNMDASTQNNLKEIFNSESGITLSKEDLTITFEEELPNTNNENFNTTIKNYKAYAELNNSHIILNVTEAAQNLPLKIRPHNIIYTHEEFFGGKQILVTPESLNFNQYSITIDMDENVTSCIQKLKEGTLNFQISTISPGASCNNITSIHPELNNEIIINNKITININNSGQLSILNNDANQISVKTSISLNEAQTQPSVTYSGNVIKTNFSEFKIIKENSAKLA